MRSWLRITFGLLSSGLLLPTVARSGATQTAPPPQIPPGAVHVQMVTDEAGAVLAIVATRRAGNAITEQDWSRLVSSEGYRRLKQREEGMHRPFTDSSFRAFVLSDSTALRAPALSATLERWKHADVTAAARRALAYLPAGTRLRATVYPVIKPRGNSFVWDTGTDSAAIFLYIDPAVTPEKLENTVAHELHHIGTAAACPDQADSTLAPAVRTATTWMGAFAEGLAMLAAGGGPDADPHAASLPQEHARWEHDFGTWKTDFRALDAFLADAVEGRISADSATSVARTFYGDAQGPWYTVGYAMGTTVERADGRAAVIRSICNPPLLLQLYNRAAAEHNRAGGDPLPLWSETTLAHFPPAPPPGT
jgi:hypothetical protein